MGFGISVLQRLCKSSIKKNLYFEIKDKVVEESYNGVRSAKTKRRVKVYGLDSTKDVRARLIEILYDRVAFHKDKFIAKILHDEMQGMEVKKNGKVEHSANTHDDQVFSYLMAMYVLVDGKNLAENYGIQKNIIKTDEDVEWEEGPLEQSEATEPVKLEEADMLEDDTANVKEQLEYLKESTTNKLYKQFLQEQYEIEQAQLQNVLLRDPNFRSTYEREYNFAPGGSIEPGTRNMVEVPVNIYGNLYDNEDEINEAERKAFNGNLYDIFMKL